MANSCDTVQNLLQGDGATVVFPFTFEYNENKPEEVNVSLFDITTKYYVPLDRSEWSFDGPTVVRLNTAPAAVTDKDGNPIANVKIWRQTDIDSLIASFYPGSAIRAQDLNDNFEQLRQAILEGRCTVPTPIYEFIEDNYWNKHGDTIDSTETWISDDEHIATTGAINIITTGINDEIIDINNDIININSDISKIEGDIIVINDSISDINDDIQDIVVNDLPSKWTKITETINTGETWVADDNNVATTGAIQKHILNILDDPQVPTKGYWNKDGDTVDSTDSWSPSDNTIATTKAIDNQLTPIKADVITNANNIAQNASDIQGNAADIDNCWNKSTDTIRNGWVSSDNFIATTKAITDTFAVVTTSPTPPNSPQDGDLWLNSVTGTLYFYYVDPDSSQWISVSSGPEGPIGPEGAAGNDASVDVGNTYTGPPGSSASVINKGTSQNAVLDFVIPTGKDGTDGRDGVDGLNGANGLNGTNGQDGTAATVNAGTTTTTDPGTNARVANVGTTNAAIFNFHIPKGEKGQTGLPGNTGDQGEPGLSYIGSVPPPNPVEGQQWYNQINGVNYIYYTDVDSSQWVSTSTTYQGEKGERGDKGDQGDDGLIGSKGDKGDQGDQGIQGDPGLSFTGSVPPLNPIEGQQWYNTTTGVNYVYYTDINSSQWVSTSNSYSPAVAGYGTSKPNTPAIGQLFYSTTDSRLQLWNGSSWINI